MSDINTTIESFPLDECTIKLVGEFTAQINPLAQRMEGVLLLFLRQNELSGEWRIATNGRELVRQRPVPASLVPVPASRSAEDQ